MADQPKAGDTVLFPDGHRDKIHSVFEGMVWRVDPSKADKISDHPIPVHDLKPSGEPNTWVYEGDVQ